MTDAELRTLLGNIATSIRDLNQTVSSVISAGVSGLANAAGGGTQQQTLQSILQAVQGLGGQRSGGVGGTLQNLAAGAVRTIPAALNTVQQLGGAVQGVGSVQGVMTGLTGLGMKFGPIAAAAGMAADALKGFVTSTNQANMALANVSPSIAGIAALSNVRDTMRLMQRGESIASPAGDLSDAIQDLKDSLEPAVVGIQYLSTGFAAEVVKAMNFVVNAGETLMKTDWTKVIDGVWFMDPLAVINAISDGWKKAIAGDNKPIGMTPLEQFLKDVADGKLRGPK